MVWSHEKKLIFVHIPKTGGTTIEYYLDLMKSDNGYCIKNNKAYQHFTWNDYKLLLGDEIYSKYFKFSIVRNPINRCISEYYWTRLKFGFKSGCSFDKFLSEVEKIVKNKKYNESKFHDHFQHQSDFILNNNETRAYC